MHRECPNDSILVVVKNLTSFIVVKYLVTKLSYFRTTVIFTSIMMKWVAIFLRSRIPTQLIDHSGSVESVFLVFIIMRPRGCVTLGTL